VIGPKRKTWRSEKYRRFVASQPCFACGLAGHSQCAHPNFGKGMGLKTDDSFAFPLCATLPMRMGCHDRHDLCLDMTREQRREAEERYTARMREIASLGGWWRQAA
jgi:hypothetical protein